jgi:hypothetical protein
MITEKVEQDNAKITVGATSQLKGRIGRSEIIEIISILISLGQFILALKHAFGA